MRAGTKADIAYYPMNAVVGRLRAGTIRSGDVITAESWQDSVLTTQLHGAEIAGELLAQLETNDIPLEPDRTYTVATTGEIKSEASRAIGTTGPWQGHGLLRDHVIDSLRQTRSRAELTPKPL